MVEDVLVVPIFDIKVDAFDDLPPDGADVPVQVGKQAFKVIDAFDGIRNRVAVVPCMTGRGRGDVACGRADLIPEHLQFVLDLLGKLQPVPVYVDCITHQGAIKERPLSTGPLSN